MTQHNRGEKNVETNCSWLIRSADKGSRCGLLQQLTGLRDDSSCAVHPSACQDCIRWYPPTEKQLNPVVASLLYSVCSDITDAGGCATCSTDEAQRLKQRALQSIPHDYDSHPIAADVHEQMNTDIADIGALIPRPAKRHGSVVKKWAVAVTTAPREQDTLSDCLSSLADAGWPDPRIVVDGEVALPAEWKHLSTTHRQPQIGAWPSYFLTMTELFMRTPDADAYLIVQDDVVFFRHPGVRSYLESVLWPSRNPGIVCLFCSRGHAPSNQGWYALPEQLVWGGPAMVYSRPVMMSLLADPKIIAHRLGEDGVVNTSKPIGRWAFETNTSVHVCSPSLVQHVGHVSSLFPDARAFSSRRAAEFAGRFPTTTEKGQDS